ncbi:proton-coupled amino acid transporter-like protein CG1139 isoform X1 [Plodia interpunctella]|uniref:proton-coupled amino acid transporter-like protein CG1139 isoform X1 n=1 Tax=Plodia interpunctella TaxID=58824 RepID=UPI00236822D5|nr:proton-coupled amino acid transporter-like protein CG1139 isoform X1 [Plodia interpunctella]
MEMSNRSVEDVRLTPSQTQSTITLHKDTQNDEEYDPFEHRTLPHTTSTLGSFFHMLKSSLGTGTLAMPAAFHHTGIIPGCIGTAIVAFIATHCVHVLVSTSRAICREVRAPFMTYTDTCENVFKLGPKRLRPLSLHVRRFVDCAMAGMCIGGTSVYVIFIASSLKDIVDYYAPEHKYSVQVYCAMLTVPLILITQIRYLKFLVPFSVFANLCLVVTLGITYYYTFQNLTTHPSVVLVNNLSGWPLFLSTAVFAMEGINVVMPVENEMEKPEYFLSFCGVLNVTMVFVAVLYGLTGVVGYLKYGDGVLGSVTLNLPQTEILSMSAKVLIAVAVFFTYCLQMYAPMEIIWTRIQIKISKTYHNLGQICLRTFSVILTVVLAVVVPDLSLLISLVGAIFFSTLGLLIPAVVQTVHKWERGLGRWNYILWKNIMLLIFYFIVLISGCYSAITAIVEKATKS